MSSTLGFDTDVNNLEVLLSCDEDALIDLQAKDLRAEEGEGRAIDANDSTTLFGVGYCGSSLCAVARWSDLVYSIISGRGSVPSFCRMSGQP